MESILLPLGLGRFDELIGAGPSSVDSKGCIMLVRVVSLMVRDDNGLHVVGWGKRGV